MAEKRPSATGDDRRKGGRIAPVPPNRGRSIRARRVPRAANDNQPPFGIRVRRGIGLMVIVALVLWSAYLLVQG